ncbi:sulfite reductase flavoprotein subunit alpha [soil metagenome]
MRLLAALAVVLVYAVLCAAIVVRERNRRRARMTTGTIDVQVIYASQTGNAEQLAERTAAALREAGETVELLALGEVDAERLSGSARRLFIASTTGEGDAPDSALRFVGETMSKPLELSGLHYGVLALGDREYKNFCAFGHALDRWLRANGATALFDAVEVDNSDQGALRHWLQQLATLTQHGRMSDWTEPEYSSWRLASRRLMNPRSAGGATYLIRLEPPGGDLPRWDAGDIAEIGPRHDPARVEAVLDSLRLSPDEPIRVDGHAVALAAHLASRRWPAAQQLASREALLSAAAGLLPLAHREYSIASLPSDGAIELLVRLMVDEHGTPGVGSGYLTCFAAIGEPIALQLRRNRQFHAPDDDRPMILIGNGTGMAGLRGLLKQRVARGHGRNWLLFGERNAAHDSYFAAEIEAWRRQGQLEHVDYAWSRDADEPMYVQHRLAESTARLERWLDQGAALYVCGSLEGMAEGVDATLRNWLGAARLAELASAVRYRRDVY